MLPSQKIKETFQHAECFLLQNCKRNVLCGLSGIVGTIADCRGEGCALESLAVHNYGRSLAVLLVCVLLLPYPLAPPVPEKNRKILQSTSAHIGAI